MISKTMPELPIREISVTHECDDVSWFYPRETIPTTTLRVDLRGELNQMAFDSLTGWLARVGYIKRPLKPERVIFNPPATIAFWNDGTKTVAKAKDGDEFDPLLGIMVCALRKVGKNRVRIDAWEPVIALLSDDLASAKECRLVADVLNATADAWELAGVADEIDELAAGGESEEEGPTEPNGTCASETCLKVSVDHDAVRAAVRDLVDKGEL